MRSAALLGLEAVLVDVEVDLSVGMPFFDVVGLPEGAGREAKVRVAAALKNSGFRLPQKRLTVNLAPADLRKEGPVVELPIALGVLVAADLLRPEALAPWVLGGELSLDGEVKPIRGVLPLALAARAGGFRGVIVPRANAAEAALVEGIEVVAVASVAEAAGHLDGSAPVAPFGRGQRPPAPPGPAPVDFSEVRGQAEVKAALELAAAGGHNVLLCGPPGSGKTMLARRLPTLLPAMALDEALEVTRVRSVLGLLAEGEGLVRERPFRAPHHTISDAGLVGGGPRTRPGELSLAHHGVLFLDELPEFRRNVLEVLRQPLEEGVVRLARASQHLTYPARVMLVGAMNPCPCGYFNSPQRACTCGPGRVLEYHARLSGPLLDRIDITLETRAVAVEALLRAESEERPSAWYRARVEAARARQAERYRSEPGVATNAQLGPRALRRHCQLSARARRQLEQAVTAFGLTARAHDRILKLARTRADLEGREAIADEDLAFAIGCRVLDRAGWLAEVQGPSPRGLSAAAAGGTVGA